jgi:hypothetical protein
MIDVYLQVSSCVSSSSFVWRIGENDAGAHFVCNSFVLTFENSTLSQGCNLLRSSGLIDEYTKCIRDHE